MASDQGATTLIDTSGEARLEPDRFDGLLARARGVVDMHLGIAARLLREGAALRAFQEVVRASRAVPMNARLAAGLVRFGLAARTHAAALALISEGQGDAEGDERLDVLRQRAKLARRTGDLDGAQEVLATILAEDPQDRRARAVLNALLAQRQRWDELDGSLDKETREALRRGHLRAASRSALRRARLWGETLDDPARAALRAMQAAQYAEQGRDLQGAFLLRLLWLRSLHRARSGGRALDEAARLVLSSGERVGQRDAAQALVDELGLGAEVTGSGEGTVESVETLPIVPTVNSSSGEVTPPAPRRRSTQLELVAVAQAAEQAGKTPEAAAIFAAAVREGPDPQAAQKLEAHFIQRGAWRELAGFYRDALKRAQDKRERSAWGVKLAELLESELGDLEGAARAWAEVAAATGDSRAVSEQVRLLGQQKNDTGIREALDAGVKQAQANPERARALVLRAEEALTRRELAAARADFEAALKLAPSEPHASAGLAELAALQGDPAPTRGLERALLSLPRRSAGRGELYRRLARLADAPLRDAKLSRAAWGEVLAEVPADEEATARLFALTRVAGDDAGLEQLLRAALASEPRGLRARQQRLELVTLLERGGRDADALEALKAAVRAEPGHREAWLAYADRLISLGGRDGEAAWALEHAATATEAPAQRLKLWRRLADFSRETLQDVVKAETFEKRAEKLERELMQNAPPGPLAPRPSPLPGGPLVIPRHRGLKPRAAPLPAPGAEFEAVAAKLGARVESEPKGAAHARIAPRVARQLEELTERARRALAPPEGDETPQPAAPAAPEGSFPKPPLLAPRIPPPKAAVEVAAAPPAPPSPPAGGGPATRAQRPEPARAAAARGPIPGGAGASSANLPPVREARAAPAPLPAGERGPARPALPRQEAPRPDAEPDARAPARAAGPRPSPALAERSRPTRAAPRHDEPAEAEDPASGEQPLDESGEAARPWSDAREDAAPWGDEGDEPEATSELGPDDVPTPAPAAPADVWDAQEEVASGDFELPEGALDREPPSRRTAELPVELGDPKQPVPPSFGPSPARALSTERQALFERVRQNPLEADGYKLLAEHFDTASDPSRSSLMLEIARALEGDPHAAPRAPRLILSATDRAGLKHPSLRGEGGELLTLVGVALCRLNPARGREAGTSDEFHLEAGKGARSVADALLAAVRILGVRSPDVFLADEPGPPIALVFTTEPRLLVGKLALKKEVSDAELRFFAGRALFTLQSELMALRSLRREQLLRGLVLASQVAEGRGSIAEAKLFREAVPQRAWERFKQLMRGVGTRLDLAVLTEGARHSANRAGLVVCGGIAPALASLRAKRALPSEVTELVRFAASERYLQLRNRNLPGRA